MWNEIFRKASQLVPVWHISILLPPLQPHLSPDVFRERSRPSHWSAERDFQEEDWVDEDVWIVCFPPVSFCIDACFSCSGFSWVLNLFIILFDFGINNRTKNIQTCFLSHQRCLMCNYTTLEEEQFKEIIKAPELNGRDGWKPPTTTEHLEDRDIIMIIIIINSYISRHTSYFLYIPILLSRNTFNFLLFGLILKSRAYFRQKLNSKD